MPRTVVFDSLAISGGNIWVDLVTGAIRLELHYTLSSGSAGVTLQKRQEVQGLLTSEEQTSIRNITARLKGVLEAQELA